MRDESDRPIVDGLRRGDASAVEAAYDKYRARIFAFLLRLSRRRDVAEELLQETWLKLARNAPRLSEDTDLAAWLFTVARNAWVSHRRWSMLDVSRLVALDDGEALHAGDDDVEAQVDARRRTVRVERALARLSVADREVLLLVGVEGFDQERAAEILGVRYDALRKRLSRARAKLQEALAAHDAAHEVARGNA